MQTMPTPIPGGGGVQHYPSNAQLSTGVGPAHPCAQVSLRNTLQPPTRTQGPTGNVAPPSTPRATLPARLTRAQSPVASVPYATGNFTSLAFQAAAQPRVMGAQSPAIPLPQSIRTPEGIHSAGKQYSACAGEKCMTTVPDASAPSHLHRYASPAPAHDLSAAQKFSGHEVAASQIVRVSGGTSNSAVCNQSSSTSHQGVPGLHYTAHYLQNSKQLAMTTAEPSLAHPVHSHVQRRYSCPATSSSGNGHLTPAAVVVATTENRSSHAHAKHGYVPRSPVPPSRHVVSSPAAASPSVAPNQESSHAQPSQAGRSPSPPLSPAHNPRNVAVTAGAAALSVTKQAYSLTLPRPTLHPRNVVVPPASAAAPVVTDPESSQIQLKQACFTSSPMPSPTTPLPGSRTVALASATPMSAFSDLRCLQVQAMHTCPTPSPLPQARDVVAVAGAAAAKASDQDPSHAARQPCRTQKRLPESQNFASFTAAAAAAMTGEDRLASPTQPKQPSSQQVTVGAVPPPATGAQSRLKRPLDLKFHKYQQGAISTTDEQPGQDSQSDTFESATAASQLTSPPASPPASPKTPFRSRRKVRGTRATTFDLGEQLGHSGSRGASIRSMSSETVPSRQNSKNSTCRDSPVAGPRRVRSGMIPRRNSSPATGEGSGRPSLYPRIGSDGSSVSRPRSGFRDKKDLDASVDTGSTEDMRQRSKSVDRRADRAEFSSTSAQLLTAWMNKRHTTERLSTEEADLVKEMFFETMPSDRAKLLRIDRMMQPELINCFCREEVESIARERENQRKHKEFMFLHGTRWENVPLICSMGLDPECGHLSKGSWLGMNAESAHTYAAKGPGPGPFEDGHRLYAMFVVACIPSHADGDEERSFGVWRIMSSKRMCPAYLVIYSTLPSLRVQRQAKHASRSPSPESPLPCREIHPSLAKKPGTEKAPIIVEGESSAEKGESSTESGTRTSPDSDDHQVSVS